MSRASGVRRLCLVGSTGLVGTAVIEGALTRSDLRIIGIARREVALPYGARMDMLLAEPAGWSKAIAAANASVLICALGTTIRTVGGDRAAFRAVDHDLVLKCAEAAKTAGIDHMIVVSSVGADRASKNFYTQVKGEMEAALSKVKLRRVDILRPGLLLGPRQERRPLERLARTFSPLFNLFLHGDYRKYRAIRVSTISDAIFALSREKAAGRFVHEYDALHYVIRRAGD